MDVNSTDTFLLSGDSLQEVDIEVDAMGVYLGLSDDIILILDGEKIKFANQRAIDFFKLSLENLLNRSFFSYLKAKDELKMKAWMKHHQSDQKLHFYLRITESFSQYVEIKHAPLPSRKGLHMLTIKPLVKYQQQKEQTLVWKNRYQLFSDLSNQLFFEWDFVNFKCVWGQNIQQFFGAEHNSDSAFDILYAFVYPDHEEILQDGVRACIYKGERLDMEIMLEGSLKDYYWCRIMGEMHEDASKNKRLIGVIFDINEKKQNQADLLNSQKAFHGILENMNEIFFRTDREGKVILINKAALHLFKRDSYDAIVGKHASELYYNAEERSLFLKDLEKHGELQSYHLSLKDSNGEEVIVKAFVRYYYDTKGEIAGHEGVFYDVTEDRRLEVEKENMLKELRNTLSSARIHIYRLKRDDQGRFVYSFSEGQYPIKEGHTTNKIAGKTFEEVYGKQQEAEERNAVEMAFQGQSVSFISKWNNEFFQSDIEPFVRVGDRVEEVIGVIYNINEVIETEKALIESEEKYKTLVENAQDGIIILQDTKFVFVNNTFVKLLGYDKKSEIIGRSISELIHPDNAEEVTSNHLKRMRGEEVPRIYETKLLTKEGDGVLMEINNNLINYEGGKAGLTFVRDLTEREKSRNQLIRLYKQNEALLEVFPLVYAVTEKGGKILHFNVPESIEMDYLKKYVSPTLKFEDLPLSPKNLEKILYYHSKLFDSDAVQRFNLKEDFDGRRVHFEFRMVRFTENEALTTVDDITDRLEYQKRLIVAKEKAEESDRLKSAFLANMSHEIRTPMNAILGFAEMLSYPEIDEDEREEFVDIIKRRGYDLLHIINDIIDVSKMEAGLMNFNIEPASINSIVKDVVSSFLSNEKVHQGQIKLVHKLGLRDGNDLVMIDSVRLKQVFINLLNNAIKFTEKGSVEISYRKEGDKLFFMVKDTGIGIKQDSQSIIFDRFMQAEMDKNRNYGGTGLGLTISKNIVEKFGGFISFRSEYGKGSEFFFEIPFVKAGTQTHYPEEKLPTDVLVNKNILIAEDEETNYLVLSSILDKYRVNCLHALDGMEAIKMIQENEDIDLVLMDIRMPRLNGIEATTEITRFSKVPVIMQTAYAFDKDINQALEAGAKDFIAKPISASKLIAKLVKYLK